jgi:membrane protease YdiL (CAAX protease family)
MEGVPDLDAIVASFSDGIAAPASAAAIPERSLALGGLSSVLVSTLGISLLLRRRDRQLLALGDWTLRRTILATLAVVLAARLLLASWVRLVPGAAGSAALLVEKMMHAIGHLYGLPVLFLIVVVLVPLVEELACRGVLLDGFRRYLRFGWANLLQAALFAGLHENWRMFPFYLALGVAAGSLARRSGTLLAPVLVHAANNGLVFAAMTARIGAT